MADATRHADLTRAAARPGRVGHERLRLEERVVHFENHTIRYQVAGHGHPLVLVHGLTGSTRWWTRNVRALAEQHRVFLVDLPGFGAMRRHPRPFVLEDAPTWLLGWMTAVGIESADLVGHSMGGYVCLLAAAYLPHAISRLVLVAPVYAPDRVTISDYIVPLLIAARRTAPAFLPLLARDVLRASPRTSWRAARDLLTADLRPHLQAVTCPTLLVWGARDAVVPPSSGTLLRELLANARLLVLSKAGHVPMFECSAEFNHAVLAFLAGKPIGE